MHREAHTNTLRESILGDAQQNSELNSAITLTGRLCQIFSKMLLWEIKKSRLKEISRQINFGKLAKLIPKFLYETTEYYEQRWDALLWKKEYSRWNDKLLLSQNASLSD